MKGRYLENLYGVLFFTFAFCVVLVGQKILVTPLRTPLPFKFEWPEEIAEIETVELIQDPMELEPQEDTVIAALSSGPKTQVLQVNKGDTLASLLKRNGVSPSQAQEAVATLSQVYSPKRLKEGQNVVVTLENQPDGAQVNLLSFSLTPSVERLIEVRQGDNGRFRAHDQQKQLKQGLKYVTGTIRNSLFADASARGISSRILSELVYHASSVIDWQRDIKRGDSYAIVTEQLTDEEGKIAKQGNLLYATLVINGQTRHFYRFSDPKTGVRYFNEKGDSLQRSLMRTPVEGARLSSGFGVRKHPILGYSKMHRGVDFAAPAGTPVLAAGNGTIQKIGRYGAYGNYVLIKHTSGYSTAYAHLSRFGKGMKVGKPVTQGMVIGHVGSTGRATGAHLHFEVLQNGKQINPKSLKLLPNEKLKGQDLQRFLNYKRDLDQKVAALTGGRRLAQKSSATIH